MESENKHSGQKNSLLKRTLALLQRLGLDSFVLALIGMIGLAYVWPEGGTGEGPFSLSELTSYGVSLIFFFYGLRLNLQKLREGLSNWRMHLLVQFSTFVLFPLLVLALMTIFQQEDSHLLWLGVFFLASLPSTVSSSVVMVSIAEGNIPAAIFNASISSIIGVFITPLWMGLVLSSTSAGFELGDIIGKLVLQVLLPVVAGVMLHGRLGNFAARYRQQLRYFDQLVILLIVYSSFSESFARKMFSDFSVLDIFLLAAGMMGLFFLIYGLITLLCRFLGFNREDRITVVFCGSKKSLVHGTVMSKVLFGESIIGIVLLPIMLYHALQIAAASMIAQKEAKEKRMAESLADAAPR
jgi:sodium/bile acid cotransporter 7